MAEEIEVESWEDLIKDEKSENESSDASKCRSSDKSGNVTNSKKKGKTKDASKSKQPVISGNELNDRFHSLYLSSSIDKSSKTKPETNSYSSVLNKNLPAGSIKILPRTSAASSATSSNPAASTIINGVGMNPPYRNLQITFEDSTRTQFIPQIAQNTKVKILQRPKNEQSGTGSNGPVDSTKNLSNMKTIQEREAEYARARARILGASYENDSAEPGSSQSASGNRPPSINGPAKRSDLNLVRTPTGPSGQSSGFAQRR